MAVNSYKQDEHSTDVGKMKTLMRLFSYLLDYKKEILAVLAIMAFCVFVSLVNPLIMENAIDKHISTGDFPGLAKLIGIAVVLNVIMILFVKLRMLIMAKVCNSILVTIRQQLYSHPDPGFFLFRQPSHRQDPRPHYRRHQLLKGRTRQLRHDADPGFFHNLRRRRDHVSQKSGSRSGFPDQPAADDLLHVVYPGVLA